MPCELRDLKFTSCPVVQKKWLVELYGSGEAHFPNQEKKTLGDELSFESVRRASHQFLSKHSHIVGVTHTHSGSGMHRHLGGRSSVKNKGTLSGMWNCQLPYYSSVR